MIRSIYAIALIPLIAIAAEEPTPMPLLGKTLDGWKAKKTGESFDGKTTAYKGRFTLAEGVLTIDPKVKGDVILETVREFKGDVTLTVEFKPGKGCNNDVFFRGQKFDLVPEGGKGKGLAGVKEAEWSTLEIVVEGQTFVIRVNGKEARKGKTKSLASPLGLRAEFGPIAFRNLRVKQGK